MRVFGDLVPTWGPLWVRIMAGLRAREARYLRVPPGRTPPQVFDSEWAAALRDRAVAAVEADYALARNRAWFEALKDFMTGTDPLGDTTELEARLNTTETPIRKFVGRLRHHFANQLIREVWETVAAGEVEVSLREKKAIFAELGLNGWTTRE
jgi:hypothetical protein